ncbi:MAG: CRTAC1 family protein [Ignavibacteriales bacterium]
MPTFADVSTKAGIENVGGLGQTAAWGDFNDDGCQDLILSNTDWRRSSRNVFLFKNRCNGTFTDVTAGSGIINEPLRSAAWADFDNDGLLDLVVATIMGGAPPILYKNIGEGVFTDVSNKAGITRTGGVIGHVIWVDYDGDGRIDLFQANSNGQSFLYHNEGNGRFKEVSDRSGVGLNLQTNSALWFDFNNDGFPDLFLANRGGNKLYLNNRNGTFTDVTIKAGVGGDPKWNSVAACAGDFNNDGFLDIYVVNISSSRNALYRNNGDGTFTDVTEETGTQDVGDGRTCAWVDFDGDGWIDLFTTNHVHPNRLFRNLGNGKFVDVAPQVRINSPIIDVFAATWGDFNNDGFMDVFLNGHIGTGLIKGGRTLNGFLVIKLIGNGRDTNTSAIGARVRVPASGGVQIREVSGGRGCCEQDMLPIHFGVGREKRADILVKWMGGKECPFRNVDVKGGGVFSISEKGCIIQRLGHL